MSILIKIIINIKYNYPNNIFILIGIATLKIELKK